MQDNLFFAADAFGLGELLQWSRLGGMSSRNYKIETRLGTFVIKSLLPPFRLEDTAREATFAERVRGSGIPTVTHLRTARGELIAVRDDEAYCAMPFIVSDATVPPNAVAAIGDVLGQLRYVPTLGLPPKLGWLSPERHEENMSEIRRDFADDPDMRSLIALDEGLADFRREIVPTLPRSIIHGDLHDENILFKNGRIAAVLDWEDAMVGPVVYDFCVSAIGWCWPESVFSAADFRSYANAYLAVRALTRLERDTLSTCMRHVAVVQTAWRFLQYRVRTPRADAKEKYRRMWTCGHHEWVPPEF